MKYQPMLASSGELSILSKKEYVFEPKLDGTRCILVKRGRRVYMFNRLSQDISYIYPHIKRSFEQYDDEFTIDGEIICYNERGLPDHRLIMRREQTLNKRTIDMRAEAISATYVTFDILELNNEALINKPLEERKKILKSLIKESHHIERVMFTEQGNDLWGLIKKSKMEGIMAKKKGSYYLPGKRSNDWLKIKNGKSVDAVISGYIPSKTRSKSFQALILSLYKNGKLVKVGKVDTGFDEESNDYLMRKMNPLEKKSFGKIVQLEPKLVCEVDYIELTKEKELRAPTYKRLRHKPAENCTWKQLK